MTLSQREQLRQKMRTEQIYTIFQENPSVSFTINEFQQKISENIQIEVDELLREIRRLLSNGKIRIIFEKDAPDRYMNVLPELWTFYSGLKEEHFKVHSLIEKSGNNGIWRRDIKKLSGLADPSFTKVISELESRKLIKVIQNIHENRKKKYILYDLVPSTEVTGGVWYQDGSFNSTLVDQLIQQVINFVKNQPGILETDLAQKIMSSSLSSVKISTDEARSVIKAVVNNGSIIKIGGTLRPGPVQPITCPISTIPCINCKYSSFCEPNGSYSPEECPYLQRLTELF